MITPFDACLLVGILVAMLLSSEPKKSAIAGVLIIASLGIALDYLFDGWVVMNLASIIESMGAILLFTYARKLEKYKDRVFFRMMSAFLFASAATVPLYRWNVNVEPRDYVNLSHAVAISHLTFMVAYSDGIRNVARNFRSYIFDHWGHTSSH